LKNTKPGEKRRDRRSGDPHWRDYIPFHEFFHGDNACGLGASHQTGWTALIAVLLQYGGALHFERPGANRKTRAKKEAVR